MSVDSILNRAAHQVDWTVEDMLRVAVEYIDGHCDTEEFAVFVNTAKCEAEPDPVDNTVTCIVCGDLARADTAHPFQGGWVGNACCWNEWNTY